MTTELHALLQQGQSARSEGRTDDAREAFANAASLAKHAGARAELVHALKGRGQIERDQGRTAEAKIFYQEAVDECRSLGDALLLAHTVRHLADTLGDMNMTGEAEPLYREALSLYRSNFKTGVLDLANALRPFATLLEATGRTADAKSVWFETRVLYNALNLREAVDECDKRLAKLE